MPRSRRVRTALSLIAATSLLVVLPSIRVAAEDAGTVETATVALAWKSIRGPAGASAGG